MDPIDILNQVNQFYATAWNQLVIYTTVLLGLFGLAVPLAIHLLQRWSSRIDKQELKAFLRDETRDVEKSLGENLKRAFREEHSALQEQIDGVHARLNEYRSETQAGIHHVQALTALSDDAYPIALMSAATASRLYLPGKDELNLRRTLMMVWDDCLPKMNRSTLSDFPECETEIDELCSALEEANKHGRYTDVIRRLRRGFKEAQEREPEASQTEEPDST